MEAKCCWQHHKDTSLDTKPCNSRLKIDLPLKLCQPMPMAAVRDRGVSRYLGPL